MVQCYGQRIGATWLGADYFHMGGRNISSKLVYSSGRSWKQYQELCRDKANLLAEPDAYIGAVGTKVYLWDQHLQEWQEDGEWKRRLDEGWNLEKVREAAYGAIQVGGTEMVHFRPPEELNEHKITLGVNDEVLADVMKEIHTRLDESQVSAKVIFSGTGGWKYVDIVSSGAGKLESLEYIREHFDFEREQTVACGDSGNDILMMEGGNRAIVVGNAQPDLVKWVTSQPEYKDEHRTNARLCVASRGHAFAKPTLSLARILDRAAGTDSRNNSRPWLRGLEGSGFGGSASIFRRIASSSFFTCRSRLAMSRGWKNTKNADAWEMQSTTAAGKESVVSGLAWQVRDGQAA
ncbi:hypothetical protein CYMTET_9385 [Cymbomonas tetramitiformis]|uniref:Sucrose phosphatase-like domain-containing protein n=1 Tax=Cymbomonas tetramitiformis TaxID=36881 RepID=A0AAE0GRR8_9CHLO|nr:hypothetical protein CYMTET_9385 [Cymbomonas tetramitiformis]